MADRPKAKDFVMSIEAIKQKPVAWQWLNTAHFRKKLPKDAEKGAWNPLYTTPQQRKPLTDEEIESLADSLEVWNDDSEKWILDSNTFARTIEAAHGIKGEV